MESKRKLAIVSAGVLVLAVGLKTAFFSAPKVKEVRVERRDLTARVYGNGTVEAKVVVGVSSKITGRIVELYADQGDEVKRGRLLALLENQDLAGQLRKAQATLELASRNARRYRNLADKNLVSPLEAEQYETAARVAEAEEAAARARLDDTRIAAPGDGLIISRHLEKGAIVTPGQAIFSLVDPRTVWVKAHVDESQLRGVAARRKALIGLRSAPGVEFPGEVVRVGHESDRVTEELVVDVAFTPPLKDFHLGEQADVHIIAETRTAAPSLPSAAVVFREKTRGVWVVAGRKLEFRPIVAGAEDDRFTEILSGLEDGARVALPGPAR
ncbi:MAG: efflux RND transporter periplasmic adaptor subunit [Elusimicrobiota bacterium]|nr:efflux RND transporter periplasmic adaptor subunit [Elusimicrobiota bacterium]